MLNLRHILIFLGTAFVGAGPAIAADKLPLDKIRHIFVIYLENHSFDNLFGRFPGANGLDHAGATATQVDAEGKPYKVLPPVMKVEDKVAVIDTRFPLDMPNRPFNIDKYVPIDQMTGDLIHRFYE